MNNEFDNQETNNGVQDQNIVQPVEDVVEEQPAVEPTLFVNPEPVAPVQPAIEPQPVQPKPDLLASQSTIETVQQQVGEQAPAANPEPVVPVQPVVEPVMQQPQVQPIMPQQPVNQQFNNPNGKKNGAKNIVKYIFIGIGAIVVLALLIIFIVSLTSKKLVCTSDTANITLMYSDKGLTGYVRKDSKENNISFDFDRQKAVSKQIGMDEYIKQFNDSFTMHTGGTCTINGKSVDDINSGETQTIGSDEYGYIDVPKNWVKFLDIDGNSSIQYTYNSEYIVSLNVVQAMVSSAQEAANNFSYNIKNLSGVSNVKTDTVKLNKYTAYEISYVKDGTYLLTYLFEADDNKIHYLTIEGLSDVAKYKSIVRSFKTKA